MLHHVLEDARSPDIQTMVHSCGPAEWLAASGRMNKFSLVLSQAFASIASLLLMLETDKDTWAYAAIVGHSRAVSIYKFFLSDVEKLAEKGIYTVSQLFEVNEITHKLL